MRSKIIFLINKLNFVKYKNNDIINLNKIFNLLISIIKICSLLRANFDVGAIFKKFAESD